MEKKTMTIDEKKKLLPESGIAVGIVLLLCYFFGFSYVWNTSYGSEVGVNGWNYIIALLTQNYKGTGALYGDIAVPFNYYAKYYTLVLSILTTVSLGILLVFIIISLFNIKKFKIKLAKFLTVILYVLAVSYLSCIVTALTMNGSSILSKYCGGNPKCSVATLAFFPFFITLITAISHTVFLYKNKEGLE